jgi:hypothetical protein
MKLPVIRGRIDRRILVNYRVDAQCLERILPVPFRPKLVHGFGVAGICLIRLKQVRAAGCPAWTGMSSENAAHRVAVEWDTEDGCSEGVYIPRRDTSSRLVSLAGGRLFPGMQSHATFQVRESGTHYDIGLDSDDRLTRVHLTAHRASHLPPDSVFESLRQATQFFQAGAVGYSATTNRSRHEGMELCAMNWNLDPLVVEGVESSFFDDRNAFPAGAAELDSAFLMQGIEHTWQSLPDICGIARMEGSALGVGK